VEMLEAGGNEGHRPAGAGTFKNGAGEDAGDIANPGVFDGTGRLDVISVAGRVGFALPQVIVKHARVKAKVWRELAPKASHGEIVTNVAGAEAGGDLGRGP